MKKIVGILVVTLLIATAVLPVVGSINVHIENETEIPVEKETPIESKYSHRSSTLLLLPPFLLALVNGDWDYWTNPPDVFLIPDGDVGIGTTDPFTKLHVSGGIISGMPPFNANDNMVYTHPVSRLFVAAGTSEAEHQNMLVDFYSYKQGLVGSIGLTNTGSPLSFTAGLPPNTFGIWNFGGGPYVFKTSGAELMRITYSGNVGIGTDTPTSKLHVIGKGTFTGGIDPPYISFSDETHESIRQYAQEVEEHEKAMQFWNGEAHRMEVYVISEDQFYTITGELIEG